MNILKKSFILLLIPLFTGCVALALTGGGLGVGYTFTNIAYKTVNHPLDKVDKAVMQASKNMGVQIIDNSESEAGRTIKGVTRKLDIIIELEEVTASATRISVDARKGVMQKDKATAAEIINQIEKILGA